LSDEKPKPELTELTPELLRETLEKAKELNEATDELNERLVEAENTIRGLKLGVAARVTLPKSSEHHQLAFEKYQGRWGLFYIWSNEAQPRDQFVPLTRASRSVRLQAVKVLPALVAKLVKNTDAEIDRVDDTTNELEDFIDEVALHAAKKATP
jgi:hypothetical protein